MWYYVDMTKQYHTYNSSLSGSPGSDDRYRATTVRIDADAYTALGIASNITGKSINSLVNEAIREFIAAHHAEWIAKKDPYQDAIDKLSGKE